MKKKIEIIRRIAWYCMLCLLLLQTGCIAAALLPLLIVAAASSGNGSTTTQTQESYEMTFKDSSSSTSGLDVLLLNFCGKVTMSLVKVNEGQFQMGSRETETYRVNDETLHLVAIQKPYWIGMQEVTQEQYEYVMGNNPSANKSGKEYPVEQVSWDDAMEFCKTLNSFFAEKLPAGYEFNLPTEAQWEYAARGGSRSVYYVFSGGSDCDKVAWYWGNSEGKTHPVGQKASNELLIFDMSGNVSEWCSDLYSAYQDSANKDTSTIWGRVHRGGSWGSTSGSCRVAFRYLNLPSVRDSSIGFRIALVPKN